MKSVSITTKVWEFDSHFRQDSLQNIVCDKSFSVTDLWLGQWLSKGTPFSTTNELHLSCCHILRISEFKEHE
jgi:hypothetical protein